MLDKECQDPLATCDESLQNSREDKFKLIHNLYGAREALQTIEKIHYIVKDDTLKKSEALILLQLRDKIVKELEEL